MRTERLGELLTSEGRVTDRDLADALRLQAQTGALLGQALVRVGALSEADLLSALSRQLDLPVQTGADLPSPAAVAAFMDQTGTAPGWWASKGAVAWRMAAGAVACAAVHPLDAMLGETLEAAGPGAADLRLAPRALVEGLLHDAGVAGASVGGGAGDASRLRELAEEAPVIEFVNGVFAEALQRRASDVHIEPTEDRFVVRMRVDGMLHTVRSAPRAGFDAISSRIKLLSAMNIGERRLPQDGRQAVRVAGQEVDLRVSSLPTAWGESMVMRLLGKSTRLPELSELGIGADDVARLRAITAQPNGVLLLTGPTGSGKTTTIYRLLSELNDGRRKIVTVEDPVEFELPGVQQVRVRTDIGLSFSAALRSILRQDPDVIMVGEIRDPETARIAVQAALTGHLVISTLHTNGALASVGRLLDLEVEGYLLSDVLRGLAAQRLVRKLCEACAVAASPERAAAYELALPLAVRARAGSEPARWREACGCPACAGSGFSGRLGVFEVAPVGAELAARVRRNAGGPALLEAARDEGFLTLFEDALLKARAGLTTASEVHRVVGVAEPEDERPVAALTPASAPA